ncbi:MAG TPA: type II secretion system F family protein, partial [Iamia sp.]|nr:type II secretion system F family protein [Iamia sp.]
MSAVPSPTTTRRRTRLLGVMAASFVTCLLVAVGPAVVAQEGETSPLSVRQVDATDPDAVAVDVIWTGDREAVTDATIREGGRERPHDPPEPLSAVGVETAMVVVVDTSRSMAGNGGVRKTQETLRTMIAALEGGEAMGIVGFGTDVEVYSEITSDKAMLLEATDELIAPEEAKTALWDGVRKASSLFASVEDLQANIVLITDGFDDSSEASDNEAAGDVARAGAAVFALSYGAENQADDAALSKLVDRVGGAVIPAPGEDDLGAGLTRVQQSLDQQYRIVFESSGTQGASDLEVTIANKSVITTFVSGAIAEGQANLAPPSGSKSLIPSFVRGTAGLVVVVVVGGLAVALAVVAIAMMASKDESSLDRMLQTYTEPGLEDGVEDDRMVQTAFVQRAVELTEELAAKQGALIKVEKKLERADLPLRAAEAIFFYLAGGLVVTILGLVLMGLMGLLIGALVGFLIPMGVLNFLGARRQKQFNAQLPDMLSLLAGSLRAGYSLVQGVDAVSQEVDGPMGRELRRVMTEARLGRELEDALEASSERIQSNDFEWAIMAIRIQREVGGNLSELLMTVADTMVDRERLRRDVSTLTAEGKMSAIILGPMPIGLGLAMYSMNPEYMKVLFSNGLGKGIFTAGIVSALIGFA